jgi:CRISPR-associated endonuclease/helicase Cas3
VNKKSCKLFLFNYNKEKIVYGKDSRYDATKELLPQEVEHILKTKDFDFLYDKVIQFKNERNKDLNFEGLNTYVNFIDNLQFRSVSEEFKLIDQQNFSCFIPMKIPVEIKGESPGKTEAIFSANDLQLLKNYGIIPDQDDKICGKKVFDFYLSAINAQKDFFEKKIELKQLQTILSKFVFSVFASPKAKTRFTQFADMGKSEYGYFYMNRWQEFYDELSGIDETAFDDIEKVQFI